MSTTETEKCPDKPCDHCTGDSSIRKADGTRMSSWEWCQDMNVCSATIDWDEVYGH